MRAIAVAKKREALGLLQDGRSTREVATMVGISQQSVSNIVQENKENIPNNLGGRPRKLSLGAAEYAKAMIKRGRVKTAVAATKILNQELPEPVSARTVRRGLCEVGLEAEKVKKRPALKKNRLNCARFSLKSTVNGQSTTGAEWYSLMSQKLTGYHLMDCSIDGSIVRRSLIELSRGQ